MLFGQHTQQNKTWQREGEQPDVIVIEAVYVKLINKC